MAYMCWFHEDQVAIPNLDKKLVILVSGCKDSRPFETTWAATISDLPNSMLIKSSESECSRSLGKKLVIYLKWQDPEVTTAFNTRLLCHGQKEGLDDLGYP